jgi:hypothetical protein
LQSSADESQQGLSSAAAERNWLWPKPTTSQATQETILVEAVMLPMQPVMKFSRFKVSTVDAALKLLSVNNPLAMASGTGVAAKHLATVALLAPPRSIQPQAYRPSVRASNFRNTPDDCLMDKEPELPNHTC